MLEQLQEHFSIIFENLPLGALVIDAEEQVTFVNEWTIDFYQDSKETVLKTAYAQFPEELIPAIRNGLSHGYHAYGYEWKQNQRTVIVDVLPLHPEANHRAAVLVLLKPTMPSNPFDADENRSWLNAEFERILDSSYDGIWICDRDGRVRRINQASEKLNGVEAEKVVGRKMEDLIREGLIDRSVSLEVIKTEKSQTFLQHLKNGKKILATGNPVFDADGQLSLVVVNERDITELNQLRTELQETKGLVQEYRSELDFLTNPNHAFSYQTIRNTAMARTFTMAMKVAKVDTTVLLQGAPGVGKGELAEQIHNASPRQKAPFIRVACASIPEALIEKELFGSEKQWNPSMGSASLPGLFETADKGTLFLDEVERLPLYIQAKLYRFLETGSIVREGGQTSKKINARVIAATSEDLSHLVETRNFRQDLFFKLNVVSIQVPSLKERIEDLPWLIDFYLKQFNEKCGTHKTLTPETLEQLCHYTFPGNLRELANVIEQIVVTSAGDQIHPFDLPPRFWEEKTTSFSTLGTTLQTAVEHLEKTMIQKALQQFHNQRDAASALGIDQSTLSRKVKKYQL